MMLEHEDLIPRRASEIARRRIDASRVVIVNGPRQSGKTALLGVLREKMGGTYVSLDTTSDLRSARSDPGGFIGDLERPAFIDEVQRGGDPLVLAIKGAVDRNRARGQFVLAGSTRFLTEPRLSESLTGRARFVDLWPLSQGEIDGTPDGFVDAAFDLDALAGTAPSPLTRSQIFERVCRGGFPEAVRTHTVADRRDFFADYVRAITMRDVRELADLEHTGALRSLVRLLGARTATELNITDLARVLGLPAATMRRYLPLLETIYLHHTIPAFTRNLTAKVVRRPKVHLVDSGLAAHLMGAGAPALSRVQAVNAGPLLESFVAGEIARQLTWSKTPATLHHWRDRDGFEVDLVLEADDGRVVGVEVKAAVDVSERDFAGLLALQRRVGPDLVGGILLHCGERPRRFGPGLLALPISSLWESAAPR